MKRSILAGFTISFALALLGAAPGGPPPLPPQPKIHPAGIPANYMMVSPCVAHMGEHWANLKAPLDGSILYGTYQGKPIFTEIMVTPKDLAAGKSYDNIKPLPGYKIDHVDIHYMPHGHPGMPFAHYDIHAYYVSHAAHNAMCPNAPMM